MKIDTAAKDLIKDNRIFADLFNQYIYGGRQVLLPEQLGERDSTELSLPYGTDKAAVPIQKFRDVKKLYTAKTDGKTDYVLYSVESQARIHYAMPVRNSLYDALAYAGQAEEAARSYRKERKKAREEGKTEQVQSGQSGGKIKLTSEEFQGGFRKEDRLIPVVTLTLWWGDGEWDGPLSLFDMIEEPAPEILAHMNNYQMNLTAPGMMADEEIMQYQTGLREVMFFIKYSKDREKLLKIMETDRERFENLEKRAADVIEAVTGSGLKYKEGDETVNMCKAIQEIKQEAYDQGKQEGEQNERNNTLREKERADAEKIRADIAENRADTAEQELIRLREEIRILRGRLAVGN